MLLMWCWCHQLDSFINKYYVAENAALIGIGIDQMQLSGLTRRMIMRTSTPPSDSNKKPKVPPYPDNSKIPNKFHAGMLCVTVDAWTLVEQSCEISLIVWNGPMSRVHNTWSSAMIAMIEAFIIIHVFGASGLPAMNTRCNQDICAKNCGVKTACPSQKLFSFWGFCLRAHFGDSLPISRPPNALLMNLPGTSITRLPALACKSLMI